MSEYSRRVRLNTETTLQSARRMRREPTKAEAALWRALRGRRLAGLKFRRQHPVGRFILDFYCAEHKLVVEVDGKVHKQQKEYDEERTAQLEAFGYRVLRFSNDRVLGELSVVLEEILAALVL